MGFLCLSHVPSAPAPLLMHGGEWLSGLEGLSTPGAGGRWAAPESRSVWSPLAGLGLYSSLPRCSRKNSSYPLLGGEWCSLLPTWPGVVGEMSRPALRPGGDDRAGGGGGGKRGFRTFFYSNL